MTGPVTCWVPDTLFYNEGVDSVLDAFYRANRGSVVWCIDPELPEDADPILAVMISAERYEQLLETEAMYEDLKI